MSGILRMQKQDKNRNPGNRHPITFYFCQGLVIGTSALTFSCGPSTDTKGGDHIPDLKTYQVDALPSVAFGTSNIQPKIVDNDIFQPFVHLAAQYQICLDRDTVGDNELAAVQSHLRKQEENVNQFGLESMINYTFETLKSFDPTRKTFSDRLSLEIVWADEKNECDLLVWRSSESEFPFTTEEYRNNSFAFFYPGQLQVSSNHTNTLPIAYVSSSAIDSAFITAVQSAVWHYLGMRSTKREHSLLNPNTSIASPEAGWHVIDSQGNLMASRESFVLFGFAALYQDVFQPEDFSRFHHFKDQITGENAQHDPLLIYPETINPLGFHDLIGDSYLRGVRDLSSSLTVCIENHSSVEVNDNQILEWLEFAKSDHSDGIVAQLNTLGGNVTGEPTIVASGCSLLITLRTNDQYPFNEFHLNGAYAHEHTVKDAKAHLNPLPIIYINLPNLALTRNDSGKYIGTVLEHEFAHFLGFRHSESSQSILYPSGYNTTWDAGGYDAKIFKRYLEVRQQNQL